MKIFGQTDKGKKRSKNEDRFVVDSTLGLMVVADGMGGHASGEVASQLASQICSEQLKRSLQTGHVPIFKHVPKNKELDPRTFILGDCVKFCNQAVFEAAQSGPDKKNMGTTLVAALFLDGKLGVANVGDSRLYVVRDGDIIQITMDHSFVQEQVNRGLLKPEDAEKSDMKNMLTRSIGVTPDVDVDLLEMELREGDYILACSDGLTKMISDEEILSMFNAPDKDPEVLTAELINKANEAGGRDNITVIVSKVEGSKNSWSTLADRVKNLFKKKVDTH